MPAGSDTERGSTVRRELGRLALGEGREVAATLYGTVIVMATLTDAYASEKHPLKLALIVLSTSLVIWAAHLHAEGLAGSIAEGRRLTWADTRRVARHELGILLAAAPPALALALGAAGVVHETTAVWLALGLGVATLGAEGVRYARMQRLGLVQALVPIGVNLGLGLVIVALKVAFDH
jgi:hypothetical protein